MGTTRYSPLVKLKKKSLDQAELSLIAANDQVLKAEDKLEKAYLTLSGLTLPARGSMNELSQANLMIQTQYSIIEDAKEILSSAREKQTNARNVFNMARIEFEKFKYLDVQELNQKIKKIKEADAKLLDEVGTMTFKRGLQ